MADITKDDVIEFISNMSVLDLSELVKELEEKFGVTAAAPMAFAASMKPVRVRLSSMPVTLAPPSPAISAVTPGSSTSARRRWGIPL